MLSRCVASQVKHNSYFLLGAALGLWLALVAVPLGEDAAPCAAAVAGEPRDEFEPRREQRPLGVGGAATGARSVQRPRYYSTELGMRGALLAGALSSEDALETRVAALNRTAARLQPALRFFMTASAPAAATGGGRANVVGFTDTREMLKPFHALKYLADNYLEEYDFFFLVADTAFVNARRLAELVAHLSVSQHVYMGSVAAPDSPYCTLEGGIVLSNSVLRAVHAELDWCVRNSYSAHHHENLGRCVLHAAGVPCAQRVQGEQYESRDGAELEPALADAVTARGVREPRDFYRLHAYVSRVHLQRDRAEALRLRAALRRLARRHPPGFRNATWPSGVRADPGLAPPPPDSRFDHLRWTLFNATHAFLPDEHRAVAPLAGATARAVQLAVKEARAWAARRWGARDAVLLEGAWRWEPAQALRYRLLLALRGAGGEAVRGVELARPLGAARLVPVPYVTESARVSLVLPVGTRDVAAAVGFLRRYEALCLRHAANTALVLVLLRAPDEDGVALEPLRAALSELRAQHRAAPLELAEVAAPVGAASEAAFEASEARAALAAALPRLARDALVLLASARMEFNEDFLNRVRMNCIAGAQWFLPVGFARYAQYAHPRFVDAAGRKPQQHTGRFNARAAPVLAAYRRDLDAALAADAGGAASLPALLARAPLRCVRAPDPGLVLAPPAPPCALLTAPAADSAACLRAHAADGFAQLDLGNKHALAKLLLELQAERAR